MSSCENRCSFLDAPFPIASPGSRRSTLTTRNRQASSVKGQTPNPLGFTGHVVSVTATHFCCCGHTSQASKRDGRVPINPYWQVKAINRFGSRSMVSTSSECRATVCLWCRQCPDFCFESNGYQMYSTMTSRATLTGSIFTTKHNVNIL